MSKLDNPLSLTSCQPDVLSLPAIFFAHVEVIHVTEDAIIFSVEDDDPDRTSAIRLLVES